MRQLIVKRLRKYIRENLKEVLIIIRNEFGEKTEDMGQRQIYQNSKKLYKRGKIKIA